MKYTEEWWDGYADCIEDISEKAAECSKETQLFIRGVIEEVFHNTSEKAKHYGEERI